MLSFKITLILVGILFMGFGYFIYFKRSYHLINNFEKDKKANRLDESYAKRVGFIELVGGLMCLLSSIVSMFFDNNFAFIVLGICIIGFITIALIINQIKSVKE